MPEIAIGRKEIMSVLHIAEWKTVKRWKKAGLPIRHLPNKKPMVIISEVKAWIIAYDELKKKNNPHITPVNTPL
jgi:hypothetical protein